MYKAALSQWYKGTCGGSGLETEFENWDVDKYTKYGIDGCNYDHTDVANHPLILFNMCAKSNEPFLAFIRLWDNVVDNILCVEYDPIYIGIGDVGMGDDSIDDHTNVRVESRSAAKEIKKDKE